MSYNSDIKQLLKAVNNNDNYIFNTCDLSLENWNDYPIKWRTINKIKYELNRLQNFLSVFLTKQSSFNSLKHTVYQIFFKLKEISFDGGFPSLTELKPRCILKDKSV